MAKTFLSTGCRSDGQNEGVDADEVIGDLHHKIPRYLVNVGQRANWEVRSEGSCKMAPNSETYIRG